MVLPGLQPGCWTQGPRPRQRSSLRAEEETEDQDEDAAGGGWGCGLSRGADHTPGLHWCGGSRSVISSTTLTSSYEGPNGECGVLLGVGRCARTTRGAPLAASMRTAIWPHQLPE